MICVCIYVMSPAHSLYALNTVIMVSACEMLLTDLMSF